MTSTGNKNPTTAEKSVTNVDTNQVSVTGKGHIQKPVKSNLRAEKPDGLVDGIHTIIIEGGRDDPDDSTLGGSTLIPKDLVQASALEELDYDFCHVPDSMANDPRQFLRISSALDDDRIKKLVTVGIKQMKNQQGRQADYWKLSRLMLMFFSSVNKTAREVQDLEVQPELYIY